jgi:hypothetical protein
MRKAHWLLVFFVACPVTQLQAAVVDRSNPDFTEQSDNPSRGGVFLDIDEDCGITRSAYAQGDSAFEIVPKASHSYENIIYQCNQHFAQFSMLSH